MRVVITDSRYKMALGPVRSLKAGGYTVACGESSAVPEKLWLASRSKSCDAVLRWPVGGAEQIVQACRPGDVVLPVGRKTVRSFARCPALAEKAHVLVSAPKVLDCTDDKYAVWATAKRLGIPVPASRPVRRAADLDAPELCYPVILKYTNGEALGLPAAVRYAVAETRSALDRAYDKMRRISPELMLQEYLRGNDLGIAVVMDSRSRPVDFISYESRREYPLSGGPTCLCSTVFRRDLLRYACAILQELEFRGIAMLDFREAAQGVYLLEINPRVWGSAALTWLSGATFFESYVKAALSAAKPLNVDTCEPTYRLGTRMKFMPQCFAAAAAELRQGKRREAAADLRAGLSGRVRDGVFSAKDPGPFLRYLANLAQQHTG